MKELSLIPSSDTSFTSTETSLSTSSTGRQRYVTTWFLWHFCCYYYYLLSWLVVFFRCLEEAIRYIWPMSQFLQLNLHHTNHFNHYDRQWASVSNSKQNNWDEKLRRWQALPTGGNLCLSSLFFPTLKAPLSLACICKMPFSHMENPSNLVPKENQPFSK